MRKQSIEDIRAMLEGIGKVWLYLSEYRITHGYLHILVTDGNFSGLADLYLTDTFYINGSTSGGPWNVSVTEEVRDGDKCVVLLAEGGALTVRALRIHAEPAPQ
jgi:hypothetical protein